MYRKASRPHICFIAHNAYGALTGRNTAHAGGIERQTSLMARWFARAGYEVSMINWDEGQVDGSLVSGVRVFKICQKDAGIRGLRFFWPRWSSLNRAMARANADIYYYNCGDSGLGQVAMWARRHGRKCVYSVANTPDCDPALPALKPRRERMLYSYGLRHSDAVVVQTRTQQKMLRDGFGIDSELIPMPCEGVSKNAKRHLETANDKSMRVLWVGRFSREKRLEWLLDVAECCPEIEFDVVGSANLRSDYSDELSRRAAGISNIKLHGRVLYDNMAEHYHRSGVLCCTSVYEGFPNTFLEAWSCGLPVVSTFDPDDVIVSNNLGRTASNVEDLAQSLRHLLNDVEQYRVVSEAGRSYYLQNHSLDVSMQKFARLFESLNSR